MDGADRTLVLAARREQLVRQAADERAALARALRPWCAVWPRFERALAVWRAARRHCWLWATPLAVIALRRPRSLVQLATAGLALWRAGRGLGR